MDSNRIKEELLEVVSEFSKRGPGYFQAGAILRTVAERLNIRKNLPLEQALLTIWGELFRQGVLGWGYDIDNADFPFIHLTEPGREALRQLSRDPSNPDGYWAYLASSSRINEISASYVKEALNTYNNNCYKATAVMVGCASESLILEIRDAFVQKIQQLKSTPGAELSDWRIKRVLSGIESEIEKRKKDQHFQEIKEFYEGYWSAFTTQIRMTRNEAGHPATVEPVTQQTVHSCLLIFPELAKLQNQLVKWINSLAG